MKQLIIGLFVLLTFSLQAQSTDTYIELLRSNIQLEKKNVIAESLDLSDKLSEKFWPIYNEYQSELIKITDKRIELIKNYAKNYQTLSDKKVNNYIERAFDNREELLKLDKKYYKKVNDAIGSRYAGKFIQLISKINALVDIQISAELPLFPVPADSVDVK